MSYGDSFQSEKNLGDSVSQKREHEAALYAKRITQIPNIQQIRAENNTNGNPLYLGYAPKGVAESSDGWLLYSLSYLSLASEALVCKKVAYGSWSNRASETYE